MEVSPNIYEPLLPFMPTTKFEAEMVSKPVI